ncbi:YeiH family protein [Nonomuraea longicatena]|uniref:Sulfate exporter family transporter n=1 Tax=Nonomuraea longicatena TaxID=83682 RepID=A0ABN1NQC5_9ACTN
MISLPAWLRLNLPGLVVASAAVGLSLAASRLAPAFSPAVVAVALGVAAANLGRLPERVRPGLRFVARRVLRTAVVLLGLQIALPDVLALGVPTLLIVALGTGVTFALTPVIGRWLGVPDGSSLLIATGVSICGASAIAAMHDCTDSDDDDVAGAVGVVTLYGTAAIALVPPAAGWLGLSERQLGVWAGASVHEVAQVAAIGAVSGTAVLGAAVAVKLARVVLLAPMVALTTARLRTRCPSAEPEMALSAGAVRTAEGSGERRVQISGVPAGRASAARGKAPLVPLFVVGFVGMVGVRSLGWVPDGVTAVAPTVTSLLLAGAMFGLGAGIDARSLLKGGRAVALGGVSTVLLAAITLAGVVAFL